MTNHGNEREAMRRTQRHRRRKQQRHADQSATANQEVPPGRYPHKRITGADHANPPAARGPGPQPCARLTEQRRSWSCWMRHRWHEEIQRAPEAHELRQVEWVACFFISGIHFDGVEPLGFSTQAHRAFRVSFADA